MKIDRMTYSVERSQRGSRLICLEAKNHGGGYTLTVTKSDFDSMKNMPPEAKKLFCTEEQFETNKDEVEAFLEMCEQIAIVAVPDSVLGVDGTIFSISIECGLNSATYTWWCDLPKEWKALDVIIRTLLKWTSQKS